ncbi:mannose-binding lectin [Mycobacterium xenopi 3993]|nr:mannose-binding lectin [Mycobacterium xenopi 3993]
MGDTLTAGQKLVRGESLTSNNGAYTLTLQDDGNLVLAVRGKAIWATGTNGQDVVRAEVQPDGNFVLYTADKPVWATNTKGKKNPRLVLQDDRNLVLYADGGAAWSTKTETDAPPPPAPKSRPPRPHPLLKNPPRTGSSPRRAATGAGTRRTDVHRRIRRHVVAIAERFYGDGSKYQVIADASGISNPDLIHPGQVLTIP